MQSAARHLIPKNRIKICLRFQQEKYGMVDVFKHRSTQKAFYGGLMVCGQVWVCPVCAAKISERRRSELKRVFDAHLSAGGQCTMFTLTFSHAKTDRLNDLLISLAKAMNSFRSGKRYNNLRQDMGLIGSVRAMEITYGQNGWHPHIHLLNFHSRRLEPWDYKEIEDRIFDMWEGATAKQGLSINRKYGVKVDNADQAEYYIGKWGDLVRKTPSWDVDSEMTKAHTKKGRQDGLTPFDFLRAVVEDGDVTYQDQFREYVDAVKGKTQLYWSRGLKQMFEIDDKSDEEVVNEKIEEADLLGGLSHTDWRYILHNGYRGKLLDLIEEHGFDQTLEMIGLKNKKDAYMIDASTDIIPAQDNIQH
jgi:hypothetical protein